MEKENKGDVPTRPVAAVAAIDSTVLVWTILTVVVVLGCNEDWSKDKESIS